ncbi:MULTISPECIES: YqiA/YcfP family alpha/beta fold hydrolase [unclassified Pusillimonas]|uniref:YqiA/YcfP family alpha/beta fold hydrolase n=1 Tax=unclassified Pusillimonas TaxID=2640016 RepID=UPI000B9D356A|nr:MULTISPECIES: YqiA/YcfP family alpha/beta fold hydrolase [unclassified Pusillimonas]OXR50755.1 esterase [Pusillimonas sp. T2]ROT44813.1 esterase [Pusillimonas sp. NJUB218]
MILYLHGFRSSPQSAKAQWLAQAVADLNLTDHWHCPQLPASPQATIDLCNNLIDSHASDPAGVTLVGSSLGGYYAGHLAHTRGCRSVLLNPVIYAARDLATQVGTHQQYHSTEPFVFLPRHVDELAALAFPKPQMHSRYFLMACTGDEVLDWKEMAAWYAGCQSRIVSGSDHGISDFPRWLPEVMQFIRAIPQTQR